MTNDKNLHLTTQNISEFTRVPWSCLWISDEGREQAIHEIEQYEGYAITRAHYYGIAVRWKAVGNLDRACFWAQKLIDNFDPKKPLAFSEVPLFGYTSPIALAIMFDPNLKQFSEMLIGCGLEEKGKELLLKLEKQVQSDYDWIDCAELWHELGDIPQAKICLERAENDYAVEISELSLLILSEVWLRLGDREKSRPCLLRAETTIGFVHDFLTCADRREDLQYQKGAEKCLEKAIALAQTWDDWNALLGYWESREENSKIESHVNQASTTVTNLIDKLEISETYLTMENRSLAYKYLCKAEDMASSSKDWADISWRWFSAANNERARVAMEKAEERADSYNDWSACLSQWISSDDSMAKRRCLGKMALCLDEEYQDAEYLVSQFSQISYEWLQLEDVSLSKHYLQRAEEVARYMVDWHEIGTDWGHMDDAKALNRANFQAEELASSISDWLICAWKRAEWG